MEKSPDAFRTISEVAELLETPAHVLRFWESRFPQIKPVKRAGGRRYYRPSDVDLLSGIRRLLHDEGLTIRGVQKILREQGVRFVSGVAEPDLDEADIALDAVAVAPAETAVLPFPRSIHPTKKATSDAPDLFSGVWATDPSDSPDDEADIVADPDATLADDQDTDAATTVEPVAVEEIQTAGSEETDPREAIADDATEGEAVEAEVFEAPETVVATVAETDPSAETPSIAEPEPEPKPEPEPEKTATPEPVKTAKHAESKMAEADAAPPAKTLPEHEVPAGIDAITGHWLPADLRKLKIARLAGQKDALLPLAKRLQALRGRVAELGRVPRR
jgi:DNA-binding transcriptional MerR regulator